MFIVILSYKKPAEDVEAVRGVHREFLDTLYAQGVLLASGPQTSKTGGILVARGGRTKDELMTLLTNDPFYTSGIADYSIIEFDPVKHHPALKDIL